MASNKFVKYLALLAMLIPLSASAEDDAVIFARSIEARENEIKRHRLPTNTIPHHYHLFLNPLMDREHLAWTGDVSIDVQVIEQTSKLTLHAHKNLFILYDFTELFNAHGSSYTPSGHYRDDDTDQLVVQFSNSIRPGYYSLNLRFTGKETCCFTGFFQHKISDDRFIASTSFEPTAARRAFPCFDEPGLKSRFRVTINHHSKYTVVSNMPKSNNRVSFDGTTITDFPSTPIMSTYMLNIVISDYPTVSNDRKSVNLYTELPLENVKYLLDLSSKVVQFMESYTGFSFGIPAIGSVLLPFNPTNPTDHWGLLSYDEAAVNGNKSLLTSAKNDSAHLLVAHELAHSWFGNRVTPMWWNDFWLNGAFATYFQYYIMDQINKNWGGMELFVLSNNQESAFPADTEWANSLRRPPMTKREIEQSFSSSSHQKEKGAAIIHMFRNILGDGIFQAGIKKYMTKNSLKSVVTDDLTNALQEAYNEANKATHLDLKSVIAPWLQHKGYPMINLTRAYNVSGFATITQKTTAGDDPNILWTIPLTFVKRSNPDFFTTSPSDWISTKEKIVFLPEVTPGGWVIMNVQASGYYRVNYDNENWKRLANFLDSPDYADIHVLNRAQLISDAFYLAQSEPDKYYTNFYNIMKYLARETEYLPWRAAYYAITQIAGSLHRSSEAHKFFTYYIFELIQKFVDKVGFEPKDTDDHYTKLARMDIIQWICLHGHTGCATYAAQKLIKFTENPVENQLHPDIRGWAFCAGFEALNESATLEFVAWADKNARELLIENIGCTENHKVHRDLLLVPLDVEYSGEPFMITVLEKLLASTDENFNFAVDFVVAHRQILSHAAMSQGWHEVSEILGIIASQVTTDAQFQKLKKIFEVEGINEDPNISEQNITTVARRHLAKSKIYVERFFERWDEQLSLDENASASGNAVR